MQSVYIAPLNMGLKTNQKPFLIPENAFSLLENAYAWRDRIKKREGLEFVGRLRRTFSQYLNITTNESDYFFNVNVITGFIASATVTTPIVVTNTFPHHLTTGDKIAISKATGMTEINGIWFIDVVDDLTFSLDGSAGVNPYTGNGVWRSKVDNSTIEPDSMIEPGSVVININSGAVILTDQGNGLLTFNATNYAYIDYVTGIINIVTDQPGGSTNTISWNYFPSLPVMGIPFREIALVNDELTLFFDTHYAYVFSSDGAGGGNFNEFLPGTRWNATDIDFFWGYNYRGIEPSSRLLFITDFINDDQNPIRYTDGITWTDFSPPLSSIVQNETVGKVTAPWTTFTGTLLQTPVIPTTVVITVGTVTFRDTNGGGILIGTPGTNNGTINYETGVINLFFSPALAMDTDVLAQYNAATTYLFQSKLLIAYYGRLLAFNVWEGPTRGGSVNINNRLRFSQVGDPLALNAWVTDIFGRGGFIDAPVSQAIVSVAFIKNTLIVFFERSTWQLRYVGEYGLPFIWERISSDLGCESTFSSIVFDEGIASVGNRAITSATPIDVQRIDIDIPDLVFSFQNKFDGPARVHGIRDFQRELIFWCYPESQSLPPLGKFPNRVLIYNYRNNTFAIFRDNVTAFGTLQLEDSITWDSLTTLWDDEDVTWDSVDQQSLFPRVVGGNQEGFVFFYGYQTPDDPSLFIEDISIVDSRVNLTIPDHNLNDDEIIFITGMQFINTIDFPDAPAVIVPTTINDNFYQVKYVDPDTVYILKWDGENYVQNFAYLPNLATSLYVGGGFIAYFPVMNIITKDFNPFQKAGMQPKIIYIDFLTDANPNAAVNVNLFLNASLSVVGNLLVGNRVVEQALNQFGPVTNATATNPVVITSPGYSFETGQQITIESVNGMTQLNNANIQPYTATVVNNNKFSLDGVDGTAFSAYTSGGTWNTVSDLFYLPGSEYAWHRFFATSTGQYIRIQITYDDALMNDMNTHRSQFELNALQIYFRPGSKNIF